MSRMKLQPAVKKETKRVGIFTAAGGGGDVGGFRGPASGVPGGGSF